MQYRQFVIWNFLDVLGFTLFTVGGAHGIGRIATGQHALHDLAILVVGVGVGSLILFVVRRHYKGEPSGAAGPKGRPA